MSFEKLVSDLNADTVHSLLLFRPELALCATIVLVLLLRIVGAAGRIDSFFVALAGSLVGLGFAVASWRDLADTEHFAELFYEPFTGMLVFDGFTIYFRIILLLFAVLFLLFTRLSGVPDRDAGTDIYPLVLGATLGMCLMASANHLLIVFLGVEMASVPSYALAGMMKGRKRSSEAALKYAVYGAGTAGIMLYGISLVGGLLGSFHIPTLASRLSTLLADTTVPVLGADKPLVLMLAGLMIMVGLAFKLSAVPFHFWCPDVFEGASAEVNAFLSVASKAAALALLVRVAIGFGVLHHSDELMPPKQPTALYAVDDVIGTEQSLDKQLDASETLLNDKSVPAINLQPLPLDDHLDAARGYLSKLIAFLAVITCTFGNLTAYGQTNIKRLLAYSTIAHAGYMMMPVAAALALAGKSPPAAELALGALTLYVAVYMFMNLGAFAAVAFLRNSIHSEEIEDYAGLVHRIPVVVVCFALILFSLVGLPPLAGFWPKVMVFARLMDAGMMFVLVAGGLNTALSLFYYLRVVKVMTMDPEPRDRLPVVVPFLSATYLVAITVPVVVLGVWWNGLNEWAQAAVAHLIT